MAAYKTPGVYAEEISTLPPSVAEVSTAIPAFFGYTEHGPQVARINTMLEYQQLFGGPSPTTFAVTTLSDGSISRVTRGGGTFLLYYAVSHYFQNGGGPCYIVSAGTYPATPLRADFDACLAAVEKEDEPTLLVFTDATSLPAADYFSLCQAALMQCNKLGDRFAIFDVQDGKVSDFRTGIGNNHLSYGAAYHPYLQTTISYIYKDTDVTVAIPAVTPVAAPGGPAPATPSTPAPVTLDSLRSSNTTLYNQVKARLTSERVILPPSAAVAGIYAGVDRDRGVWKAPANVSAAAVIGPVTKITNEDQESFNVDPMAGKSINAIRAFSGKGTLVWGARTLAGNDNEWRYVSVRRLFITIEESSRNATSFAVFEPNDATTWLKVRGVIESYLYGLWERGALAGATPDAAYFVNVGLGKTMTTQDVLEGRMIVEIGVAAVRPAEFIVLRFSHKLQQA
jgi:phage tail sheath protein FI